MKPKKRLILLTVTLLGFAAVFAIMGIHDWVMAVLFICLVLLSAILDRIK